MLARQGLVPAATDDKVCQGGLGLTKKEEKAVERFRTLHQERLALSASEAPKPNSPGLPLGSYLDSCQGCSLHQDTLTCTHCNMHNTAPASSALVVASCAGAPVDNIQGSLRCSPRPNALDIPQGGYQHSCLGCAVRGGGASRKLECTDCETASGGRVAAGFELARCPPPYALDNNNGNLVCHRCVLIFARVHVKMRAMMTFKSCTGVQWAPEPAGATARQLFAVMPRLPHGCACWRVEMRPLHGRSGPANGYRLAMPWGRRG